MKREPSIHITESQLKAILKDAKIEGNIDDLVKLISIKAYKHRLNNRKMLATNQVLTKKALNVLSSSSDNTSDMIKAILYVRKINKHRGISPIRPGTKDYTIVKTITSNAENFYREYFEPTEKIFDAFVTYVKLAFSKTNNKFILNRLPNLHQGICESYEANISAASDANANLTRQLLEVYNRKTIEQTGTLFMDYSKIPEKYAMFVKAAEICKKFNVNAEIFITAQFESLKWANAIPEPYQLINERGLTALQKYMYQNPDLVGKQMKNTERINKFKNIGKNGSN